MKKISFAGPWITDKEVEYVTDATINGFYENYDGYAKKLENEITSYLGVKYSIATHCCTVALHMAALAIGLKDDDEVIVTDFSWVATAYAISYTGAKCVFVDIDPDSWCISAEAIEAAITNKTKAIMLVHSFGYPAQMDKIMSIAKKYNLKVIEDAAPALGSEFKGQKVGTFGDVGCFSFQGAKLTVSGEGGVFVTNDEEIYKKALLLSSMGRTDSNAVFWSDSLGYQYTIANLTAALALAQVERVDELIHKKREIFNWYYSGLKDVKGIKFIKEKEDVRSNYCYPSILLEDELNIDRDKLLDFLRDNNIHCRPGFPQMSKFPIYEQRFENKNAHKAWKRGVSLASAANLNREDINLVCKLIREFIELNEKSK
ncbi:perosamine synthetase [beta proteobacterium KB13]|uniref:Perosamine synthetase n=1 Tax=beta proteobacterium KB13 TaxID=314607 RepID=B6BTI3_9PROT|nr:perosamine synthetase [beta proteobacterium KB13]